MDADLTDIDFLKFSFSGQGSSHCLQHNCTRRSMEKH